MTLTNRDLAELLAAAARDASDLETATDAVLHVLGSERVYFASKDPPPYGAGDDPPPVVKGDDRQLRLLPED